MFYPVRNICAEGENNSAKESTDFIDFLRNKDKGRKIS
jgi:hypothetical protein